MPSTRPMIVQALMFSSPGRLRVLSIHVLENSSLFISDIFCGHPYICSLRFPFCRSRFKISSYQDMRPDDPPDARFFSAQRTRKQNKATGSSVPSQRAQEICRLLAGSFRGVLPARVMLLFDSFISQLSHLLCTVGRCSEDWSVRVRVAANWTVVVKRHTSSRVCRVCAAGKICLAYCSILHVDDLFFSTQRRYE